MGNRSSTPSIEAPAEAAAVGGGESNNKPLREKLRFGTVLVHVTTLSTNRRASDRPDAHVITPRGGILHGTQCNPLLIQRALASCGRAMLAPTEISLGDSRAHKLLITYSDGWWAIPSPEVFSRHSGTCLVLGDRNNTCLPYAMKLGDCFRLGSVGLVVSELKTADGEEQRLDSSIVQFLKDEAFDFDAQEDLAALAADEGEIVQKEREASKDAKTELSGKYQGGMANGERFICYMCYETHDTPEDPLVAPCDCKGDTRYLHVQCLQRWYQSSVNSLYAQVIRTTGTGAPACKICGTAYKTTFKSPLKNGRKANLLEMDSNGPYISLVVVTRHDTNPGLFNTKFRLNFGRRNAGTDAAADLAEAPDAIMVGRSSTCNMILDYRTVSTVHAKLFYENGQFFLQDRRSSNGTMVYLQEPMLLSFSNTARLRMGRSTITLQAKRNWVASMRHMIAKAGRRGDSSSTSLTPQQIFTMLSEASATQGTALKSACSTSTSLVNAETGLQEAIAHDEHLPFPEEEEEEEGHRNTQDALSHFDYDQSREHVFDFESANRSVGIEDAGGEGGASRLLKSGTSTVTSNLATEIPASSAFATPNRLSPPSP